MNLSLLANTFRERAHYYESEGLKDRADTCMDCATDLEAALAQQAQPLDALHRLRAETNTSFGHMYLDEIHADLTGDEVCPGGCPQFAQQAQPEQKEAGPPLLPTECQPCTVSIPQPEMPARERGETACGNSEPHYTHITEVPGFKTICHGVGDDNA